MRTHPEKRPAKNNSKAAAESAARQLITHEPISRLADNRQESVAQRHLQAIANSASPIQAATASGNVAQLNGDKDAKGKEPAKVLNIDTLEAFLTRELGNNWCYVGGYACNLWFDLHDLEQDEVGDIEIAVSADEHDRINYRRR